MAASIKQKFELFLEKKGLTPLPEPDFKGELSTQQQERLKLYQKFQRTVLKYFTVRELQETGCWDKADAKVCNLSGVQIHPLYQQLRWGVGKSDIGNGYTGTWSGQNPLVWEALEPSLKLASLFINHSHIWRWLDSLLHTQWQKLDPSQVDDGCPPEHPRYEAYQFQQRDHPALIHQASTQGSYLVDLAQIITFRIESIVAFMATRPGYPRRFACHRPIFANVRHDGSEDYQRKYIRSQIEVMCEMLTPLLWDSSQWTESERLIQQFSLAKTIVHETMHAAGAMAGSILNISPHVEPFYQNEELAELGRSWETAVFGGHITPLHKEVLSESLPAIGLSLQEWPNFKGYGTGKFDIGKKVRYRTASFPAGAKFTTYPIPIDWIEKIMQESYWDTEVTRSGMQAFDIPQRLGKCEVKGGKGYTVYGKDYNAWVLQTEGLDDGGLLAPKNLEEMVKWVPCQQRRIFASAVKAALLEQDGELQARTHGPSAERQIEDKKEEAIEQTILDATRKSLAPENESDYINLVKMLAKSKFVSISTQSILLLSTVKSSGTEGERQAARDLGIQMFQRLSSSETLSDTLNRVKEMVDDIGDRSVVEGGMAGRRHLETGDELGDVEIRDVGETDEGIEDSGKRRLSSKEAETES